MENYINNEHSGLESERRPLGDKQLCDLISLSLISLNHGVKNNRENFIGEFLAQIRDDERLANVIYEHLLAISIGMKLK